MRARSSPVMPPPVSDRAELRPGEVVAGLPATFDAGLFFIGVIRTPWRTRSECPRAGDIDGGPLCRVELDPRWLEALASIDDNERLQFLYWMDRTRRDLVRQSPASDGITRGTFALRSPNRPNPIASSVVRLLAVDGPALVVRGLDCTDGTPLLDIKPEFCFPAHATKETT